MRNITKIRYNSTIVNRITQFYITAKHSKYNHSYSWEDVFKDIELAYQDRKLIPTNKTTPEWFNAGFNVARNNRMGIRLSN